MSANVRAMAESAEAGEKPFSLLSDEKLIEIYTAMRKCRALSERSGKRIAAGREAVLAASLLDLREGDALALAEPDLLARFLFGASLKWVARKLATRDLHVAMRGQQATAQDAVEEARACKRRKAQGIVVVLLPVEWAGQKEWVKAIGTAWKRKLPMIFIACATESNFTAELPVISVDGLDAVAIYRVMTEASVRARKGGWPTLISCVPFTLQGAQAAGSADAIGQMESYLCGKNLLQPDRAKAVAMAIAQEMDSAGILRSKS